MELLIPIVATAGITLMGKSENNVRRREGYTNVNKNNTKQLIKNTLPTSNYPVISNDEIRDSTVQGYHSKQPRDRYYSKTIGNDSNVNEKSSAGVENFMSLTGESMTASNITHNNMQPYFGAKIRGRTTDFNSTETILDNQVGSGSQMFNKTERAPLFQPQQNYNYVGGAPNQTEFLQSRVNPSMKMSNVKPWKEIQVAPGLNGSSGSGFNSGLQARDSYKPRNVDELRIKTNPKQSFSLDGHKGPATSYIKNYATKEDVGKVEKNRPDRFYDGSQTMGQDKHALGWGFTTTGLEKKQTARGTTMLRHENRSSTTSSYEGIASSEAKKAYIPGEYSESHREESKPTPISSVNAIGRGGVSENDYGLKTLTVEGNNRSCTEDQGVFGAIKGAMGAVAAPFVDILKPSRKENYIGNIRQFGNMSMPVTSTYTNNSHDQLKVTNREMDACSNNHLNYDGPRSGAYYLPKTTNMSKKEIHREHIGVGGGSGISTGKTSYSSAYNANINQNKEGLVNSRMNHGNASHQNRQVNYQTGKLECDRVNTYIGPAGNSLTAAPPSVSQMGVIDAPYKQNLDVNVQRMEPSILEAFKKNPYTQSLTSSY